MGYHWVTMKQAPSASWIDRFAAHPLLISGLIFAVALALRFLALDRYVTPDELIWVYRSVLFREAVGSGRWADTLVAGHPGVITTWLGTAALSLQLALQPGDQAVYTWITQLAYLTPDNMAAFRQLYVFLDSSRTAVAIVNSLGVVAVFWLVRELLDSRVALAAAFILAIDPFVSGLSGLFHVDGLLMTWSIISLLTLALGVGLGHKTQDSRLRAIWLILSGVTAALAVLSKSPGLMLLPVTALAILSLLWRENSGSSGRRFVMIIGYGTVWLSSFAVILLLLYPALWLAPLRVFSAAGGNASRHVAEALRPTFFMGDVAFDHGPIFYPVALLWRLSPLIVGGLILLIVFLIQRRSFREREMRVVVLLALWALLFLIGITFAAKKFDRYLLPVIPALAIIAAVALAGRRSEESRLLKTIILLLAVAHMAMLTVSIPYLLSAYNPLVGGPYTAQYVLPLGWGESVSAGGMWLATTSDAAEQTALSGIAPSLAPFFPGTTLFTETAGRQEANHIILTANSRQVNSQLVAQADAELELSHTVRYGLLPQGWIYNNLDAQPVSIEPEVLAEPVSFGGQVQLLAQDLRANQIDNEVLFTARWRKEQVDPLLIVKIQLQDKAGIVWQELETELLNDVYFYPQHWQPEETPDVTYRLALPPAMPPGSYTVQLSLIDQKTKGQLPIVSSAERSGAVVYDAGTVELELPLEVVDPGLLEMIPIAEAAWLDGDLRLLGIVEAMADVQAGGEVQVELLWQVEGQLPAGLQLALQLNGSEPMIFPLSNFDTDKWTPGAVLRQKYAYHVPGDMVSGDYGLSLAPLESNGEIVTDTFVPVGKIHVEAVDRLFSLPPSIAVPLEIRFEPGINLRGVSPEEIGAVPGETVALILYWQTEVETEEPLTAFIHLLDENGSIVAQVDRWPGGVPSNLWSQNQVIIDEYRLTLPSDIAPGDYQIATGLYTAGDGKRLPAFDSSQERIAGDLFLLPLTVSITK